MNNSGTDDVHFVQMWVTPDTESIDPGYEQLDINGELDKGGLVPIASGKGHDAAISIRQAGAVLYGGRLAAGRDREVPTTATSICSSPVGIGSPRAARRARRPAMPFGSPSRRARPDRRRRRRRSAGLGDGLTS